MRRIFILLLVLLPVLVVTASDFSYILKRGDNSIVMAGNINIHSIERFVNRWKGDYLWARIDGREYLIRDAVTMADARAAFKEVDKHHEQEEALHDRMKPVERRHEALEERIDDIGDTLSDDDDDDLDFNQRAKLQDELRKLREQIRPLERELRKLEEEEERLDVESEKLEEAAERELVKIIRKAIRNGVAQPL